jgi:hypothetical protein
MPGHDAARELMDLVAVHSFYIPLLEGKLGHSIPQPAEVVEPSDADDKITASITALRNWLALLDMALQPVMLRDALKSKVPESTIHALIRYYLQKKTHGETDRDKTDFIATSMFRSLHPEFAELGESFDRGGQIEKLVQTLESELVYVLADVSGTTLRDEHRQLLNEFEFLHQEVDDFRTFDQLMDSGIVQRVRDIKQSFADGFFHPSVLAQVAVYNAIFGKKFDDLFRATTEQIKNFAVKVQDEGASIMSKLDENVTVKNLADVEDQKVMTAEYGQAQEEFRKISKLKKVVDKRGGRQVAAAAATGFGATKEKADTLETPASPRGRHAEAPERGGDLQPLSAPVRAAFNPVEDSKIRTQLAAIRNFVRAAEKAGPVVPLTRGAVTISPAESEAFRADYSQEKSFRADYANTICTMIAMLARLVVERHEMQAKQDSAYLWKPHAEAIAYIVGQSPAILAQCEQMISTAQSRGLEEKVSAIKATAIRLRVAVQEATAVLRTLGS